VSPVRLLTASLILATAFPAAAGSSGSDRIDVVVVEGRLDERSVDFVMAAIEEADGIVVLRIDASAVLSESIDDLIDLVADPPVPVAVWVGPEPSVAHGAVVELLAAAQIRGAAPGTRIGWASPRVAGGLPLVPGEGLPADVIDGRITVTEPIPGLIDRIEPSIGQFIVGLDGLEVTLGEQVIVLETAKSETVDGLETLTPSGTVRFVEEGLVDRVLHAATAPEAAFFFLVAGLGLVALEFYSAGPGIAAAAAALMLLLGGYGVAVLPVSWPGVGATFAGIALLVVDVQRNDLSWRSLLGLGLLLFGGLRFTDGAPQVAPVWWVVVLVVVGAAVFFGLALTTTIRTRFSTQTIGREHLIGKAGVALGPIAPEGTVEIETARWRARSTRRSGIAEGDAVVVVGIEGVVLQVDPRETS
jgi:membrane-bound serine protease (ClpP class)